MAQQQPSHDPSDGIHQDLLPHVHLVSANPYPNLPTIDFNVITKWLLAAPGIAKDKAPFFWTYLDRPKENSVLLTWQPLQRMGTAAASDGIIWGPEQQYRNEVGNGLVLEVYFCKQGFAPGDVATARARRRCRLVLSGTSTVPVSAPQPDVSLWMVHYSRAEKVDQLPINMIPFTPATHEMMSKRNYLQGCGQIARKEFMLSDRANWPHIPWPQQGGRNQIPGSSRRMPASLIYPAPDRPTQASQRARNRAQQQAQAQAEAAAAAASAGPDGVEEDPRDIFEGMTPREIALVRLQQNRNWMQELLLSPFRFRDMTPADLGLGLRGELNAVTDGIFDAPGGRAVEERPAKPYVGRLEPEKADEFRKRAQEHVDKTRSEIEQMKAEHEAAVAKFKTGSIFMRAANDLRYSIEDEGPEFWRLEGRLGDAEEDEAIPRAKRNKKPIADIAAEVEAEVGRPLVPLKEVNQVQAGGYQEPVPSPPKAPTSNGMSRQGSQQSGVMVEDPDVDMGGTAAGLLDQMHSGLSNHSTPVNNFPTPQGNLDGFNSNPATPANANPPSPAAAPSAATEAPEKQDNPPDVTMGNTEDEPSKPDDAGDAASAPAPAVAASEAPAAAPVADAPVAAAADAAPTTADPDAAAPSTASAPASTATPVPQESGQTPAHDDWVMVPKGGVESESPAAPSGGSESAAATTTAAAAPQAAATADTEAPEPAIPAPDAAPAAPVAAVAAQAPTTDATPATATEGDANDLGSLGDLDTAGDALTNYGTPGLDGAAGSLGEGLDLNMEMEGSAFGDAFQGASNTTNTNTNTNTNANTPGGENQPEAS